MSPIFEYECRKCGKRIEKYQYLNAAERLEIEGKEPGSYVLVGSCPEPGCEGDCEMVMPHTGKPVVK